MAKRDDGGMAAAGDGSPGTMAAYFDAWAPRYDEVTSRDSWAPPKEAERMLRPVLAEGMDALDVGIGTGESALHLLRAGCRLTGVDISAGMLALARAKLEGLGACDLIQTDISHGLPERLGRTFDVVQVVGAMEFVEDLDAFLDDVLALLRPGGHLCLTFEALLPDREQQDTAEQVIPGGGGRLRRRAPAELNAVLDRVGLERLEERSFAGYQRASVEGPVLHVAILAKRR